MTLFAQSNLLSAYGSADFFGRCIFLSLFLLSVICWVAAVHKTIQTRKAKRKGSLFQALAQKEKGRLLSFSPTEQHPFAQVFTEVKNKTLEVLDKNHYFAGENEQVFLSRGDLELVEAHALVAVSGEAKKLEKDLFILSTIVTLAPFLGLLGTVWGILLTFGELQLGGAGASNTAILGGLSTALATTVFGLVIAIPALIFHSYLKNSLKYLTSDMEDFLYRLLSTVELQYRKP
jgi:biopolymer transport protein TolQ